MRHERAYTGVRHDTVTAHVVASSHDRELRAGLRIEKEGVHLCIFVLDGQGGVGRLMSRLRLSHFTKTYKGGRKQLGKVHIGIGSHDHIHA